MTPDQAKQLRNKLETFDALSADEERLEQAIRDLQGGREPALVVRDKKGKVMLLKITRSSPSNIEVGLGDLDIPAEELCNLLISWLEGKQKDVRGKIEEIRP